MLACAETARPISTAPSERRITNGRAKAASTAVAPRGSTANARRRSMKRVARRKACMLVTPRKWRRSSHPDDRLAGDRRGVRAGPRIGQRQRHRAAEADPHEPAGRRSIRAGGGAVEVGAGLAGAERERGGRDRHRAHLALGQRVPSILLQCGLLDELFVLPVADIVEGLLRPGPRGAAEPDAFYISAAIVEGAKSQSDEYRCGQRELDRGVGPRVLSDRARDPPKPSGIPGHLPYSTSRT